MKFIINLLPLIIIFLSSESYSGHQGGTFKVTKLRLGPDGVHVAFSPAPTDCNGGTHYRTHARLSKNEENYESILSALLVAYSSRSSLSYIWYRDLPSGIDSCSNTEGYLGLTMVELSI